MSDSFTPVVAEKVKTQQKKRQATSPLDLLDFKQFKSHSSESEDLDSDTCTDMDSSESEKPHIKLGETELQQISQILKSTFESQMTTMIKSIVDGVVTGLQAKVSALETENATLRSRVQSLENMCDKAEQYSRRNCLRISGMTEVPDESTDAKILELASNIGANLTIEEIDRSHRLGRPKASSSAAPRDIIVKFVSYRARQKLITKKSKLKQSGRKTIYINEDLTKQRSNVYYQARQLARSKAVHNAWTFDGTIFIKDRHLQKHRIETLADLDTFKRDASIA